MTAIKALARLKRSRQIWPGCELRLREEAGVWYGTIFLGNNYGGNNLPARVTYDELHSLHALLKTDHIAVKSEAHWTATDSGEALLLIEVIL